MATQQTMTPAAPAEAQGPTPDAIMQLGVGFWGSKALLSAVELGLFSELSAAGPLDGNGHERRRRHAYPTDRRS